VPWSFLVEIGGLCSLRFFFCSQFTTAVLTTSFASGVETAGPLIDTCSNKFSMSFFSLLLSRVLILLTALAPLSGQALVTGGDRATSLSPDFIFTTCCKAHSNGVRALFSLLPRAVDGGMRLFQASRSNLNLAHSAARCALVTSLSSVSFS